MVSAKIRLMLFKFVSNFADATGDMTASNLFIVGGNQMYSVTINQRVEAIKNNEEEINLFDINTVITYLPSAIS